ncbi:ABC transporter ATP-binding protein [Alkalilimnicola sp. S0819]|nr:ABC transporter ATP-binding protein [Alkalilimnicola sp. S0819]MPQ16070.1 ATP-binding cassette domain-containing protein [Alkalilimnicola sp. S0819]
MLLQAEGLTRAYGERQALHALDLTVRRGEVLGLLGPNGAGKSTTLRLLSGCLPPSAGRIRLGGVDLLAEPARAKRRLGYLPEHPPLHPELSVQAYLAFCARLRGVPRGRRAAAVERALERCGLGEVRRRLIGRLSKGYQQRVGIAQALVHDPALVILDEPTVGLDPLQLRAVRALIGELRGEHAVVFSSHILSEVQALCDRVLILARGRVVYSGAVREQARADQVVVAFAPDPGAEALATVDGITVEQAVGEGEWLLRLANEAAREALLRRALARGWQLREWRSPASSLEQLFLRATQQEAA